MKQIAKILSILLLFSISSAQSLVHQKTFNKIKYANTVKNLEIKSFDVVGNRLYAIYPGTSSWRDSAAALSIVNLETLEILAVGGQYSPKVKGFNGYPDQIDVFGNIAVVDGKMFFNVSNDSVNYLGSNYIESKFKNDAMHTFKKGNYLYIAIQSIGLGVYDMTDPLSPKTVYEKDYEDASDYPYGVFANDKHIFLCDINAKKIYIHKNSGDYSIVGTVGTKAYRVATHGNLLYTDQKEVYDITDPASPVKITDHNYTGKSSNGELKIFGDHLFITGGGHKSSGNPRASIYNIKDRKDIKLITAFEDSLPSYDIDFIDNKVYVSFGSSVSSSGWTGSIGGSVRIYSLGEILSIDESQSLPGKFALHENYPNPFNPSTTIRFDLPVNTSATLTIYNTIGQKVKSYKAQGASSGRYKIKWNGTNEIGAPVSAGIYLYELQTKESIKTKKMILLK